ncbi:hypothetical protein TNIN_181461 [Trichonephila inaurata madagascariensis]|uniref:Uncharacterized protein n=1 Tax=Trichonephila inaurata madagascariensis TaxID=2747483 RepID=A0A8X7BZU8_9ARAC|nr:hypothetical protein TNIN_181461 [Trichonephila inaurata madagascariensis]
MMQRNSSPPHRLALNAALKKQQSSTGKGNYPECQQTASTPPEIPDHYPKAFLRALTSCKNKENHGLRGKVILTPSPCTTPGCPHHEKTL